MADADVGNSGAILSYVGTVSVYIAQYIKICFHDLSFVKKRAIVARILLFYGCLFEQVVCFNFFFFGFYVC